MVTARLSGVARSLRHEGNGECVHEIKQKSHKFLRKYNKLTLSQLKRLQICGRNRTRSSAIADRPRDAGL